MTGYYTVGNSADHVGPPGYEVLAPVGNTELDDTADIALGFASPIWTRWASLFRNPPAPNSGVFFDSPWQIYVVPLSALNPGELSVTLPYCTGASAAAVVLAPATSIVRLRGNLAHELFHLFQDGQPPAPGAPNVESDWWIEATADWGRHSTVLDTERRQEEDDVFLHDPESPLDAPVPPGMGTSYWEARWRFVEFLASDLGSDFAGVLNDTFSQLGEPQGGPARATRVVSNALASIGRDLGTELGQFWGEHLVDGTVDGTGTRPRYVEDVRVNTSSRELRASAERLAADFGRIQLASDVRQVSITIGAVPQGGHLWLRLGSGHPSEERSTGAHTLRFCVEGSAEGARPWPGQLTFAYTNGGRSGSEGVTFTIDPSSDRCEEPHTCPVRGGTALATRGGQHCQRRRPPPSPGCGSTARRGIYDTSSTSISDLPREYLDVQCNPRAYVYTFGGGSTCDGTPSGDPVSFGPGGAGVVVDRLARGPGVIRRGHFDFTYDYFGATIHVSGMITPNVASGTVEFAQIDGCNFTQSWSALWRRP